MSLSLYETVWYNTIHGLVWYHTMRCWEWPVLLMCTQNNTIITLPSVDIPLFSISRVDIGWCVDVSGVRSNWLCDLRFVWCPVAIEAMHDEYDYGLLAQDRAYARVVMFAFGQLIGWSSSYATNVFEILIDRLELHWSWSFPPSPLCSDFGCHSNAQTLTFRVNRAHCWMKELSG